jgi:hypothetical protein
LIVVIHSLQQLAVHLADDDDDLMFLGRQSNSDDDLDAEPALIIRVDDDGFW